jgi:23S rRNA pseudouridine2605 synthase
MIGKRRPGRVPLNRALSKLGIASRSEATRLIGDGRVSVDGRIVHDPLAAVVPERVSIAIDGQPGVRAGWRLLILNKPRGVVTTRRDPQGRQTVFDLIGDGASHLVAVGRLDLATSGLLLLTSDTRLADWLTDPANAVARVYTVTVRGEVRDRDLASLTAGVEHGGERLSAASVEVRKRSRRETHLVVRLHEGRNREIRRLFQAVGHEVTALRRVSYGGFTLGGLQPGRWREVAAAEVEEAIPAYSRARLMSRRGSGCPAARSS